MLTKNHNCNMFYQNFIRKSFFKTQTPLPSPFLVCMDASGG